MAEPFLGPDFLLPNESARRLYREYAADQPIFDYHCHLPVQEIADNRDFPTITQVWLGGDHYKWRAMRALGIDERLITGDGGDYEKFAAWAEAVPYTVRNPLYHWTHMELRRPFEVDEMLSPRTAERIYRACNDRLRQPELRTHGLLRMMNVRVVCTTDDPADSLEHHERIRQSGAPCTVVPGFRADHALAVDDPERLNGWLADLGQRVGREITGYDGMLAALAERHAEFHAAGCRLSDHGLEVLDAEPYTEREVERIFREAVRGQAADPEAARRYRSAVLYEMACMDADAGWVQQFHLGALRNTNRRGFEALGRDSGYDSIGDPPSARSMARFFDRLEHAGKLPKTILYNLDPAQNDLFAAMIGNFQGPDPQGRAVRGRMQFGTAWWYNDQIDGMTRQMEALSNSGLLSCFVGMVTDSRSFLSYPRHDYFRRLLCGILGDEMERGLLPADFELLGGIVADICYGNAERYFGIES